MANTENIEAKLCAYVDGELDDAGRAEIEAHLAANPQHRQLMEELRGQRDLLRDLPRTRAPHDLLETVQNQLERSALLDDGRRPEIAGRISAFPRIMSVAAVLVMAIGLFAIIYYILPSNSLRSREYARDTEPSIDETDEAATQPSGETTVVTDATERDKDLSKAKDAGDRTRKLEMADSIAPAATESVAGVPTTQDVFAKGGPVDAKGYAPGSAFYNMFADAEAERKIKQSTAVPTDSLVMVVSCPDPTQAQGEVQKYLENNKIRWECVTEPVPQMDLKETQALSGSRLGQTQMRLKSANDTVAMKGGGNFDEKKQDLKQQEAAQTFAQKKEASSQEAPQQIVEAPAGAPPPSASTPNIASNAGQQRTYDLGAAAPSEQAPAQHPSRQMQQKGGIEAQQPQQQQQLTLAQQPTDVQAQSGQGQSGQSQLIVARGLTRRQVSELNDNLSVQNAGRVSNYRRSGDNFTPTTLPGTPPAGAIGAGASSTLAVTAGPPLPALSPTTQPYAIVPATQPGTLTRESAPNKYKFGDDLASNVPAPTTPSPAVRQPATDVSVNGIDALQKQTVATTMPASALAAAKPASPAAGPATHPSDDRCDVVILIQTPAPAAVGQALDLNAAAPASQPAIAPNAAATAPAAVSEPEPNDTPPTDAAQQ